jgi:hypothetical protein
MRRQKADSTSATVPYHTTTMGSPAKYASLRAESGSSQKRGTRADVSQKVMNSASVPIVGNRAHQGSRAVPFGESKKRLEVQFTLWHCHQAICCQPEQFRGHRVVENALQNRNRPVMIGNNNTLAPLNLAQVGTQAVF